MDPNKQLPMRTAASRENFSGCGRSTAKSVFQHQGLVSAVAATIPAATIPTTAVATAITTTATAITSTTTATARDSEIACRP
jgi:hypothetical protein